MSIYRATSFIKNNNNQQQSEQSLMNNQSDKRISKLETEIHNLKHKQRRNSMSATSLISSSVDNVAFERETRRLKLELAETKRQLVNKNIEIERKNENIQQLEKKMHQIVQSFKTAMIEKDVQFRELHNQLIDLKGQIRVAVRIRESKGQGGLTILNENRISFKQNGPAMCYQFEHIFEPKFSQEAVFAEVHELILSVLHGYNVCLIAYGPTGSGKTFTMRGEGVDCETEGVIPRSVRFLLQHASQEMAVMGWQIKFSASYLEVYNEEVYDLLNKREKCKVRLMPSDGSTNVEGLIKLPIECIEDVETVMELADCHRSTASTALNSLSSRSHALFQIHVNGVNEDTGVITKCCLNLVDLAGSERVKESGAKGERFTELTNINQSLSTLKKCIRAQMNNGSHVPYRESKLTVLLRAYLGAGSSKTMFIAHLNPTDVAETKRTLDFTGDLRSTNLGRAQSSNQASIE